MTDHLNLLMEHERKVIRRAEGCRDTGGADRDIVDSRRVLLDREVALRTAFQTFVDQVKTASQHIPMETGVCCCGDPMDNHDPFSGHSPRDEGEYFMTRIIIDAEEALRESTDHGL